MGLGNRRFATMAVSISPQALSAGRPQGFSRVAMAWQQSLGPSHVMLDVERDQDAPPGVAFVLAGEASEVLESKPEVTARRLEAVGALAETVAQYWARLGTENTKVCVQKFRK